MGRGLVGHDVGAGSAHLHAADEFREDLGGVADQGHGLGLAPGGPVRDHGQRLVQRMGLGVAIAGADAEVGAGLVAFDGKAAGPGHHGGQRLRAAHPAQARRQDPLALEIAAVMLAPGLGEGLVGALNDALRADVDPRARGHLAVHGQALLVEFVEMVPVRPVRHQVRVGDQHAWRVLVGAEDAHGLAGLDQQRLVLVQPAQGLDYAVEVVPGPRRPPDAAIDDQLVRVLGHVGMQVVHQHPQRRLGQPAFRRNLGAGRGEDVADVVTGVVHVRSFQESIWPAMMLRWISDEPS